MKLITDMTPREYLDEYDAKMIKLTAEVVVGLIKVEDENVRNELATELMKSEESMRKSIRNISMAQHFYGND